MEDKAIKSEKELDDLITGALKMHQDTIRRRKLISKTIRIISTIVIIVWAITSLLLITQLTRLKAQNEFYEKITNANSCYWTGR